MGEEIYRRGCRRRVFQRSAGSSQTMLLLAASLVLEPLETDKTACHRLWTGGRASKEYLLIENRQKSGRDAGLPGSGLAAMAHRRDTVRQYQPAGLSRSTCSGERSTRSGIQQKRGRPGTPVPGSQRVTKVDDSGASHPHTRKNDGTATGIAISSIKVVNGDVTADVIV